VTELLYSTDTLTGIPLQVLVWASDSIRGWPTISSQVASTLDFHLNLDRMDQQRYVHTSHWIYPSPWMPYYRRGYPHALWSSILPRCMPIPCGSWMSSGLLQPIRNYSKRFTGTKNLRWNLDLFPSSLHHVWISSQLVSANDPCLLSLQLCQISLLARIKPNPRDTDCSLHDFFCIPSMFDISTKIAWIQ
jgi:hypothetical protein